MAVGQKPAEQQPCCLCGGARVQGSDLSQPPVELARCSLARVRPVPVSLERRLIARAAAVNGRPLDFVN